MFAFLILFAWFVFFLPDYLGHADNYIAGQPAGDAAAHRAGVVLPALLRHPARHPLEAVRRHRHVLGRSPSWCSCRGSTRAACARPSTGRSTSGSSGCSSSPAWRSAISAPSRRRDLTCSGRASSRSTTSRTSWSCMPIVGWLETPTTLPRSITEAVLGKSGGRWHAERAAAAPEEGLSGERIA